VLLLATPAMSGAAVTIGSDLAAPADDTVFCAPDPAIVCTGVQTALPGRQITSPIDGVIVRWRMRDSSGTFALRVIRSAGGGNYTGAGTSAPVTAASPGVVTFATRLSIKAGDFLGVNVHGPSAAGVRNAGGAVVDVYAPALADGQTRPRDGFFPDTEGLANADIEPDADGDGFGDETQDLCSKDVSTQGLCKGPCANDRRGTEGPDTLGGTEAGDNMFGLGGNDTLTALGGEDCLFGGTGQDRLAGDAGDDRLVGEGDADTMDGGLGQDQLTGGPGGDRLQGGAGDDTVSGEADNDVLDGAAGVDVLSGGPGRDRVGGGPGDDRLSGGAGNDTLRGGANKDRLRGEAGNDSLRGEAGDDRIEGGAGNDKIDVGGGKNRASGGAGRDDIRAVNRKTDRISCGGGRDKVRADARDRVASNCERVVIRGR
jgi:Ca2+-binding RTX toxin-like protein